jgi:hypothetical protein
MNLAHARQSLSSWSRHKRALASCASRKETKSLVGEGREMQLAKFRLETWLVVDRARNDVVSTHATQDEAEGERDKRNGGLSRAQYNACIAIEPVAQGMCRPCR